MNATLLAAVSLASSVVTWFYYLARVKHSKTPARPVGSILMQTMAVAAGIGAVAWTLQTDDTIRVAVVGPASLGFVTGSLFLFLLTQRKTPVGEIKVKVGDTLPAFSTMTSEGAALATEGFAGQRILLKFFRGSW